MLADVHMHLAQDPALSLERAKNAGVDIVLAAAMDVTTSRINVILAEKFSQVKACVGIHPWRSNLYNPEAEKTIAELIKGGKVTAISETGIDTVRCMSDDFRTELAPLPLEVQIKAFRAQVRLAINNDLFLVLHDRGATSEILNVFDDFAERPPRGIVHGFSGTIDEALMYRQRGFLIAINKRDLPAINSIVETLTLNEIALETDSNEPGNVVDVCEAVALLKKVTRGEVEEATTANLKNLIDFGLS
ncbi:TatD family hydrolase [Pelotomaculum isophthalicicum JI]|uniref:TatD family hydrolase n=1 Tax=Pelotomaculum isophthalicicum JI TaxID=947010 RepID=A0A9X4H2C1_9FIRM|nr:TatD family hydrolase [Pelotomaculum isophthalicicum]MDF9408730.1 TatD family hydrolase [Pelotomaculum isophthalicicum JI]